MRYDITLTIGYDYGGLANNVRMLARLLPSDHPGRQIVTTRRLRIDPVPQERQRSTDFFGNAMTHLAFHKPIDRITFTVGATVERVPDPLGLDLSPTLADLKTEAAARRDLGGRAPHHMISPSPRIGLVPEIAAYAADQVAPGMTSLQVVEAVGQALHRDMAFVAGATDAQTPPQEAFAHRAGVCQDFSHIMIAALRSLGLPAGYVSGFLRTLPPPGQPRLEGADAMHAWVQAWCGDKLGWVEYDPTNACFVTTDHIVVAYGRDYSDVAPLKGALRSAGEQQSQHSVDVRPIEAPRVT